VPRDRARIEGRLVSMGLGGLLQRLLSGPLNELVSLPLNSTKTAKAVQRLLYAWMTFYPEVKAGVKMRLDEMTGTLLILPCGLPERRGRRPILV
jgi:hypothetical protein